MCATGDFTGHGSSSLSSVELSSGSSSCFNIKAKEKLLPIVAGNNKKEQELVDMTSGETGLRKHLHEGSS